RACAVQDLEAVGDDISGMHGLPPTSSYIPAGHARVRSPTSRRFRVDCHQQSVGAFGDGFDRLAQRS
ncbi:MAG TPA: hypothetical protein VF765_04065, partial [Polyangiaceae bacterium]